VSLKLYLEGMGDCNPMTRRRVDRKLTPRSLVPLLDIPYPRSMVCGTPSIVREVEVGLPGLNYSRQHRTIEGAEVLDSIHESIAALLRQRNLSPPTQSPQ
jgi:hypothetical protein